MGLGKKKQFTRKNGTQKGGELYKWSVLPSNKRASNNNLGERKIYCTALPRTQGEDWVVTYVYNITVINGVQIKNAYVECGYVK